VYLRVLIFYLFYVNIHPNVADKEFEG